MKTYPLNVRFANVSFCLFGAAKEKGEGGGRYPPPYYVSVLVCRTVSKTGASAEENNACLSVFWKILPPSRDRSFFVCFSEQTCLAFSVPAPYVKVYLVNGKRCISKNKTHTARRTLDPLYQQQLIFRENFAGCVLQVSVTLFCLRLELKN